MLTNEKIKKLLDTIPNESYRKYLSNKPIALSQEMAAALGTQKRQTIKVLQTVIDAISSKLFIETLHSDDTVFNEQLTTWLNASKWETLERAIWKAVIRDGKTYILTAYENNAPLLHHIDLYNGRDGAYVFPGKSYGINTWYDGDTRYLDIYYTDAIEKYINQDGEWIPLLDEPIAWTDNNNNPLGLALIEFCIGESDLANGAIQLQDDINFALIDLLATSRTMGWPQRYIKGASSLKYISNPYGQALTTSAGMPIPRSVTLTPGSIQLIGKDEELGQLDSADPNATVFDKLLHALYIATTVPSFYFSGDFPSGVALILSEQRLNHKVESHQGSLTSAVKQAVQMMQQLSNTFGNTGFNVSVDVDWHSPEILTEDLKMEIQKNKAQYVFQLKNAQVISTETAVRILHEEWTEDQIQAEVARIQGENAIL